MTGGESRHKNVGLGAFDSILLDTGVDSFQDIVGTKAERTEIEGSIGDEIEQMGGVLDSDSGGFVDPLKTNSGVHQVPRSVRSVSE